MDESRHILIQSCFQNRVMAKRTSPPSLRTQYIALTLLLGILVVITAFFSARDTVDTGKEVTQQLMYTASQLDVVNEIHGSLIELYRTMDLFLLDPQRNDYREQIFDLIEQSRTASFRIGVNSPDAGRNRVGDLFLLADLLDKLQREIETLFNIRMDAEQQYPALSISANNMQPFQNEINGLFSLMIDEIESGDFQPQTVDLYPHLLKTRSEWISLISQVRVYLANRFGSFSTSLLAGQADSTRHIYQSVREHFQQLKDAYRNEKESFAGTASVDQAMDALDNWFSHFQQVRAINESDQWRADSYKLEVSIIPLMEQITSVLFEVEDSFKAQAQGATEILRSNSNRQVIIMIVVIALFLLLIGTLLLSMEFMVFRPIANVALALRSRAFGHEGYQALRIRSRETQYLIDAFQEMDTQVGKRQRALEHQALHDVLTGLPNRAMLNEHLNYQILVAHNENRELVLFILDLNRFKEVNDSLGHGLGDQLLIQVAERFKACIRETDTIARLGGDEFAVLLPNTSLTQSVNIAQALHRSTSAPFEIEGNVIPIDASIGIAGYPMDGSDGQALMQHADVAMYISKRNHLPYEYYDQSKDDNSIDRIALMNHLRSALKNDQLELYFQPQIYLESGEICGAEALLRWDSPDYGFIQPEKIVDLAEHIGIVNNLTIWILDKALNNCRLWHDNGFLISVSVNLSARNLTYRSLFSETVELLKKHRLEAQYLTLEITETTMMTNPGRSIEVLERLNNMGIKIAIDDFGTGFSSLAYLKKLPVSILKIDKSFVLEMDKDENDAHIVHSTVQLGHNIGLKVVAEGIETGNTRKMLESINCDTGQGYLICHPMPARPFRKWLEHYQAIQRTA